MKKITKKNQSIFINEMEIGILKMGAVPFISDKLQFDLKTKYGILWVRIDDDNETCYSVFARFVDISSAPMHLSGINSFSGKWNHHYTSEGSPKLKTQLLLQRIETLLN
jgi:hypothetical protein